LSRVLQLLLPDFDAVPLTVGRIGLFPFAAFLPLLFTQEIPWLTWLLLVIHHGYNKNMGM